MKFELFYQNLTVRRTNKNAHLMNVICVFLIGKSKIRKLVKTMMYNTKKC